VRPGREIGLLDLSAGGALIEAPTRLLPGTCVELQLAAPGWRWTVTARVLRCRVSALVPDQGVRYKAALMFERALDRLEAAPRERHLAYRFDTRAPAGYAVPRREHDASARMGNDYPPATAFADGVP
jgi:hypothetical protein